MNALAELVPTLDPDLAMRVPFEKKTKHVIQGLAEVPYDFFFYVSIPSGIFSSLACIDSSLFFQLLACVKMMEFHHVWRTT